MSTELNTDSNGGHRSLKKSQINRLQHIQNSLARAIVIAPKFTLILKFHHWIRRNEHIKYKILYLTFRLLYTTQPPNLYDLSLSKLHVILDLHLLSLLLVHQLAPP